MKAHRLAVANCRELYHGLNLLKTKICWESLKDISFFRGENIDGMPCKTIHL